MDELAQKKYEEKQAGIATTEEEGDDEDLMGDEELQAKLFKDNEMANLKEKAEHAQLQRDGKLIAKGVPDKIDDDNDAPPTLEEISEEQRKKEHEAKTKSQKDKEWLDKVMAEAAAAKDKMQ